jgi:hypothetical protein
MGIVVMHSTCFVAMGDDPQCMQHTLMPNKEAADRVYIWEPSTVPPYMLHVLHVRLIDGICSTTRKLEVIHSIFSRTTAVTGGLPPNYIISWSAE